MTREARRQPPQECSSFPAMARFHPTPIAVLADFSSRYLVRPDIQTNDEHQRFTDSLILSLDVHRAPVVLSRERSSIPFCGSLIVRATCQPGLFWAILACDRSLFPSQTGLPGRSSPKAWCPVFPGAKLAEESDRTAIERSLVEQTHGLMVVDMVAISELCRNEKVAVDRIDDGVRRFKLGVTENPWAKRSTLHR